VFPCNRSCQKNVGACYEPDSKNNIIAIFAIAALILELWPSRHTTRSRRRKADASRESVNKDFKVPPDGSDAFMGLT